MRKPKSSAHSVYLLTYHVVWIPKYRRRILTGVVADRLRQVIVETAAKRDWEVIALEVMPDHVHLFLSVSPPVSPADLVKIIKGITARRLLMEFPELQRSTGRGTLWASAYFVGTAGNVSAETIQRYIEDQTTEGGD